MPGELLGAQDCQSSVSAVLTRRFLPVETCLEFNSNADLKGVTFMDIGLPNQAYQAGVDWADDPIESLNRDDNVRTSGVRDPVQRWAKKGQSSVAIISSSPELLLILVGWFPNNTQRLTRIQKQNTRRRYNLMSQVILIEHFFRCLEVIGC